MSATVDNSCKSRKPAKTFNCFLKKDKKLMKNLTENEGHI